MQAVIIAALVIGIPLAIYCVCTVKREEIFEEGSGKNAEAGGVYQQFRLWNEDHAG